jgi:acetoacetyl-CoA reductase
MYKELTFGFFMSLALVTGGTRGIGASIGKTLKQKGYHVIAIYHSNHEAAKVFSKETDIEVKSWDVSDYEKSIENINSIIQAHKSIDVLVHNAGITRDSFLHKMTLDQWKEVIDTNLNSCFNITKPVIENMRNFNKGKIVYISSVNGQKGQIGQTNYGAAKAGIIGFAKSLALENASKNINVNVICPGYVETEMVAKIDENILSKIIDQVPQKRLAKTQEIADTVSFLIDEKSHYITGAVLNINGGLYM